MQNDHIDHHILIMTFLMIKVLKLVKGIRTTDICTYFLLDYLTIEMHEAELQGETLYYTDDKCAVNCAPAPAAHTKKTPE